MNDDLDDPAFCEKTEEGRCLTHGALLVFADSGEGRCPASESIVMWAGPTGEAAFVDRLDPHYAARVFVRLERHADRRLRDAANTAVNALPDPDEVGYIAFELLKQDAARLASLASEARIHPAVAINWLWTDHADLMNALTDRAQQRLTGPQND